MKANISLYLPWLLGQIILSPKRQVKCTKFAEKYFLSQKRYYFSKVLKNLLDDLVLGGDFPVLLCLGIIPLASKVAGVKVYLR
jgi:hypothetical protein